MSLLIAIESVKGQYPKANLQFSRIFDDFVLKSFIREHEIGYSNDVISRTPKWKALVTQSNIGKHLALIRKNCKLVRGTTANFPIIELNAR